MGILQRILNRKNNLEGGNNTMSIVKDENIPKEPVIDSLSPVDEPLKNVSKTAKEPKAVEKHSLHVVKELPVEPIRKYTSEDGTIVHLITIEEALTELLSKKK